MVIEKYNPKRGFSSPHRVIKKIIFLLVAIVLFQSSAEARLRKGKKILVFTKTKGFYHTSIVAGVKAIQQLGDDNKVQVDTTSDAGFFTSRHLKQYDAIVFLSTTGDVLNDQQQRAFQQYISRGGGFVGIHAAADTEYDWPWYNALVGAYFLSHPQQQQAQLVIRDSTHPSTRHLPATWKKWDEWYNYKSIQPHIKVLITLEESSYSGGTNGSFHPIAWYHEVNGGRAFYTGLGHTDASFTDPLFLQHLWGGITYAMKH
ncbi:MAG: ThuA domain-containing protein [Chitinophagaceae bacterium]|jgi:type 1 glutamine amidotransferase|nr:ThuA domain-containing protein [Chitinophagaceae bacterium]MCA6470391.1 ThuA domain-containing protein [Chitinophagaceae bacterium]MCA6476436.1 ThuA domain-containing protein [Chitinophagaceae bacterium]